MFTLDSLDAVSATLDDLPFSLDCPVWAGVACTGVVMYGQSLGLGPGAEPVISDAQPYLNLTFVGGTLTTKPDGTYATIALVEGDDRETPCSGLANMASTLAADENGVAPEDFYIMASSAGHGGRKISQLSKGDAEGLYQNFLDHVQQAAWLSAFAYMHYIVATVPWVQGENDTPDTSREDYRNALVQLASDIAGDVCAITGQASPPKLLTYQTVDKIALSNSVALAQLDAVAESDDIYFVTPIYHLPHLSDGVHLTNVGSKLLGCYFGRAGKQLVLDGRTPDCITPRFATATGSVVTITLDAPSALVIDNSDLAETTDAGLQVRDSEGTPFTITDIEADGLHVAITVDGTVDDGSVVRYAMDYLGTGLVIRDGASGNLRDSTTLTTNILGTDYPLWHVAPAFELPVIIVEG